MLRCDFWLWHHAALQHEPAPQQSNRVVSRAWQNHWPPDQAGQKRRQLIGYSLAWKF